MNRPLRPTVDKLLVVYWLLISKVQGSSEAWQWGPPKQVRYLFVFTAARAKYPSFGAGTGKNSVLYNRHQDKWSLRGTALFYLFGCSCDEFMPFWVILWSSSSLCYSLTYFSSFFHISYLWTEFCGSWNTVGWNVKTCVVWSWTRKYEGEIFRYKTDSNQGRRKWLIPYEVPMFCWSEDISYQKIATEKF